MSVSLPMEEDEGAGRSSVQDDWRMARKEVAADTASSALIFRRPVAKSPSRVGELLEMQEKRRTGPYDGLHHRVAHFTGGVIERARLAAVAQDDGGRDVDEPRGEADGVHEQGQRVVALDEGLDEGREDERKVDALSPSGCLVAHPEARAGHGKMALDHPITSSFRQENAPSACTAGPPCCRCF